MCEGGIRSIHPCRLERVSWTVPRVQVSGTRSRLSDGVCLWRLAHVGDGENCRRSESLRLRDTCIWAGCASESGLNSGSWAPKPSEDLTDWEERVLGDGGGAPTFSSKRSIDCPAFGTWGSQDACGSDGVECTDAATDPVCFRATGHIRNLLKMELPETRAGLLVSTWDPGNASWPSTSACDCNTFCVPAGSSIQHIVTAVNKSCTPVKVHGGQHERQEVPFEMPKEEDDGDLPIPDCDAMFSFRVSCSPCRYA